MSKERKARPLGITVLIIFFLVGTVLSFIAGLSLLIPSGYFDLMWRLNPRGHDGLILIGQWGVVLLFGASIACATAAIGLWRRARWGHATAVALIAINLLSDIVNAASGVEPRAIVGVPIALAVLLYLLSRQVRSYFNEYSRGPGDKRTRIS